ncbi:MAG: hypothetical protein AAGK74_15245, partial [Chloroflexota bacterium]
MAVGDGSTIGVTVDGGSGTNVGEDVMVDGGMVGSGVTDGGCVSVGGGVKVAVAVGVADGVLVLVFATFTPTV